MKARLRYEMTGEQRRQMKKHFRDEEEARANDWDAAVLWTLHSCFGFGKKRLLQFYHAFREEHRRLREYYSMERSELGWLYAYKLKQECGIDIAELNKGNKGDD